MRFHRVELAKPAKAGCAGGCAWGTVATACPRDFRAVDANGGAVIVDESVRFWEPSRALKPRELQDVRRAGTQFAPLEVSVVQTSVSSGGAIEKDDAEHRRRLEDIKNRVKAELDVDVGAKRAPLQNRKEAIARLRAALDAKTAAPGARVAEDGARAEADRAVAEAELDLVEAEVECEVAELEAELSTELVLLVAAAATRADLRQVVIDAYLAAVAGEARLANARRELEVAESGLAAADARVKAGRASPLERQRAEVTHVIAKNEVAQAERRLTAARANLGARIGQPVIGALDRAWFERIDGYGPPADRAAAGTLALAAAEAPSTGAEGATTAGAGSLALASSVWTASAPCFSPPMSMSAPLFMSR